MWKNKYFKKKIDSVFGVKSSDTLFQLFKYAYAGGFSFLIDFGTLIMLTEYFHIHYLASASTAYIFGLMINYFLSVYWVFDNRSFNNRMLELLVFTIIGLIGLLLNQFFLWILTDILLIYYAISKIITSSIVFFWNFLARKFVLFNTYKS